MSEENIHSSNQLLTRKHVGSLFNHQATSRNKFPYKSDQKDQSEINKDYRKGVLIRRSLAQTPPIFK